MIIFIEGETVNGKKYAQGFIVTAGVLNDEQMMDGVVERAMELLSDFANEPVHFTRYKVDENQRFMETI